MARRSRRVDPDFVLDADRGLSDQPTVKQAEFIRFDVADAREQRRRGLRAVDEARDALTDLTRPRRDRDRATPRDVAGEVPDSRMTRSLPEPSQMRTPLSARQRNARSATKWAVQDRLTATQHAAVAHVLGEPQNWRDVNDELSAAAGNVQQLEERERLQVQRVDRAIQAYERENHRGHVVYSNVRMPRAVAGVVIDQVLARQLKPGSVITFDRFTAAAHTMHQVEVNGPDAERTVVCEIQTTRGMYLGRSDKVDDTAHLLPRGMRLRVVGSHTATYRRPDGTTGQRHVIQLKDQP